jgi:hypothetical protein
LWSFRRRRSAQRSQQLHRVKGIRLAITTPPARVASLLRGRRATSYLEKLLAELGEPAAYSDLEISPDDKRAAVAVRDPVARGLDLWIFDMPEMSGHA